MHISNIITSDIVNGVGVRLSVFVSGCRNHCKGCFSEQTWDFNYGEKYTNEIHDYILKELQKPQYDGITILGGDPFEPENQPDVMELLEDVKSIENRNIWMYTGYTYEYLREHGIEGITDHILDMIDVLVDGRFEIEKRNILLPFKGSSNQRLIDVQRTISEGNIILYNV